MTRGYWKCNACGYAKESHLTTFVNKCPKCETEYELLGKLQNFHTCHDIPVFRVKGEDFSSFSTNRCYLIARSKEEPKILCFNENFYNYLSDLQDFDMKIQLSD